VFTRPTTEQKAEEVGKQIKEGFKQGMAESGYISENATDEGSKFGRLAESGKVQVDSEGKVVISENASDDMLVRTGWFERRNALLDEYAKNASDAEEALKNFQGYVITYTNGPTHIDPATGKAHRNDHICNHQCRALAKKAREEYQAELRQKAKGVTSEIHPKALRDIEEQFGVHIDPATGEPHRNDHICAPICKVLADKAHFELELREAEYLEAKARTDLEAARMKVAVFKDKLQAIKDQLKAK
jgi:hypothetical protein